VWWQRQQRCVALLPHAQQRVSCTVCTWERGCNSCKLVHTLQSYCLGARSTHARRSPGTHLGCLQQRTLASRSFAGQCRWQAAVQAACWRAAALPCLRSQSQPRWGRRNPTTRHPCLGSQQ
jgi:hypothetical protein